MIVVVEVSKMILSSIVGVLIDTVVSLAWLSCFTGLVVVCYLIKLVVNDLRRKKYEQN